MTMVFQFKWSLRPQIRGSTFSEQTKMFIAKAVVIILYDRRFSLINKMLSFQRHVEFFILITQFIAVTQSVISITSRFLMLQTDHCRSHNNSPFVHCLSQFMQRVSDITFTALRKYGHL